MAQCNREKFLVHKNDINEELFPIEGAMDEYVTKTGKFYTWYHDDMYYPKVTRIILPCGYIYTSLRIPDDKGGFKMRNKRVHIILAKTFIPNPNPKILNIVGHKDNNKTNNNLDNLYWTTNQENTQKAVDDGLSKNKIGIDNDKSCCIAVYDKQYHVVGVYGSICECARCIENINKGAIARCIKTDYVPRTRNYIYTECTKEFYMEYQELQGAKLTEYKAEKKMRQFIMKNEKLGLYLLMDNQKAASSICGIAQASISQILRTGQNWYGNWYFEVVKETTYKESSAYQNLIDLCDNYLIKNIYTGEIREYQTAKDVMNEFNLNGHDLNHYCATRQTMLSEWKVYKIKQIKQENIKKVS